MHPSQATPPHTQAGAHIFSLAPQVSSGCQNLFQGALGIKITREDAEIQRSAEDLQHCQGAEIQVHQWRNRLAANNECHRAQEACNRQRVWCGETTKTRNRQNNLSYVLLVDTALEINRKSGVPTQPSLTAALPKHWIGRNIYKRFTLYTTGY